jgi:glutamate/tyrosine decarboxylase-like PLP-dependent enzyme
LSPHSDEFRPALEAALKESLTYLDGLDTERVSASADATKLRAQFQRPLPDQGLPCTQVISDLARAAQGGIVSNASGRFFGWVIGGSLPAALAADWLSAAWDQNAAIYACSPAAAVAEEVAGEWLKDLFGLPAETAFGLVTGCQMAHVTCLAAARHTLLADRGWDVEHQGMSGAPAVRVFTSPEHHATADRAVRLLGLGVASIIELPSDDQGRLKPEALEAEFARDPKTATIVLLQAGDLNMGTFDDFATLIPLAHRYNAWVHVDGAFGLWARTSPGKRHLAAGVELADSWATDGHKWLNVPYDCGYAFVRDANALRASMTYHASYKMAFDNVRDQVDFNPEWSRRARGFPTYAALLQLGRIGVADLIDRCCAHAHSIVTRIGALPGAELLWTPTINQGLVRFLSPKPNATPGDHDLYTDEVIKRILADGEVFFGGVTWRGMRAMRVSVCNWQTNESDVDRAVNAVGRILAADHSAATNVVQSRA